MTKQKIDELLDSSPMTFGKYEGKTPEEIADDDPSYIIWLYDNVTPKRCSKDLRIACEQDERDYEEEKFADQHFGLDGY